MVEACPVMSQCRNTSTRLTVVMHVQIQILCMGSLFLLIVNFATPVNFFNILFFYR